MKKYVKTIIILIIICLIPLVSYAEKMSWDEFYIYFMTGYNNNPELLSEEDYIRMAKGAQGKELSGDYGQPATWEFYQNKALEWLTSKNQAQNRDEDEPGVDTSVTGVDEKKAEEKRKKIYADLINKGYNVDKMDEKTLKTWLNIIDDYAIAKGGAVNVEEDIMSARADLDFAYSKLTGKSDSSIFEGQVTEKDMEDDIIYQNPEMTGEKETTVGTIENIMDDADEFMNKKGAEKINPLGDKQSLQKFSQTISGILLTVGIVIAVIMGGILGIKYMAGPVEDKADIKQLLVPYVIGCIVVFGAITIWSIVVNFGEQFDEKESITVGEEQGPTTSTSSTPSTSGSDAGTSQSGEGDNKGTDTGKSGAEDNKGTDTGKSKTKDNKDKEGDKSSTTQKNPTSSSNKGSTSNKKTTVEVKTILLDRTVLMLDKDHYNKAQLKSYVYPSDAKNKKVTWKSSKTSVATVDSKGNIKAKAAGTTVITATTANGKKAKCTITVIKQMSKWQPGTAISSNEKVAKLENKGNISYWRLNTVKWTREQLESYINNAEGLCKTKDFYNYPEAASGRFPYYTGNPYDGSLRKNYINKKVGISATDYLILATTMNQRIYIFEKNSAGTWKLKDEEYTSTGRIMNPNSKACWNASNVNASAHNRFDFYIGAMYRSFNNDHRMKCCYEFWQCGQGGNGIEGTGGTYNGTIKEPYYAHRALHSTYNPPGDEASRLGRPTTSRMCYTSL